MKCRIIKKITSPPAHVITSRSRGGGLLHGARGSSFDVTERTPRLVQSCCTMGWFHPPPHTEDALPRMQRQFDQADHKQILLSEEAETLFYLLRCEGDSELAEMQSVWGSVWNMFHRAHNAQSVVGCKKKKIIRRLCMNGCQNVPSNLCMHSCGPL